ncbi:MBL fold metallo-hydrolase [Streptomyces sp. L7]
MELELDDRVRAALRPVARRVVAEDPKGSRLLESVFVHQGRQAHAHHPRTCVVHACVLLDFDGAKILTDPWFSERVLYRQGEPRSILTAADLPRLDGILISHAHYDHCDLGALARYPDKNVPIVVNRGTGKKVRGKGAAQCHRARPLAVHPPRPGTRHRARRPATACPRSPTFWRLTARRSSSAPTPAAYPNSTRSPSVSPTSTWP